MKWGYTSSSNNLDVWNEVISNPQSLYSYFNLFIATLAKILILYVIKYNLYVKYTQINVFQCVFCRRYCKMLAYYTCVSIQYLLYNFLNSFFVYVIVYVAIYSCVFILWGLFEPLISLWIQNRISTLEKLMDEISPGFLLHDMFVSSKICGTSQ